MEPRDTKVMDLGTRLVSERERCIGMTDAERAWRRQYLLDQRLAPHEPLFVEELWNTTHNPIRRFYRKPLDVAFKAMEPVFGSATPYFRYFTGKFFIALAIGYGGTYYFKYKGNDWTQKGGWRVIKSNPSVFPGDPTDLIEKFEKPSDFSNRGFKNSPI